MTAENYIVLLKVKQVKTILKNSTFQTFFWLFFFRIRRFWYFS